MAPADQPPQPAEELRTITVLHAEITASAVPVGKHGPEAVRELVSRRLAAVIAEVEALEGQ